MHTHPTASEIFCESLRLDFGGPDRCHYCGLACDRSRPHGEPPFNTYHTNRPRVYARCPSNGYQCAACQEWKRPRMTASFLEGGFADGTRWTQQSWLVHPGGAHALRRESAQALYGFLMRPPCRFFLSVYDPAQGGVPGGNLLQLCHANDNAVVDMGTELKMTVNNVLHTFSIYELSQSARDTNGLGPGVAQLVRCFGPVPAELLPREEEPVKRGVGRPKKVEDPLEVKQRAAQAVLTVSGQVPA